MDAKFGGKLHNFYGPDLQGVGKRSMEWDLNDWRWDGDLFMAAPLPSDCRSRQFFPVGSDIPLKIGPSNGSSSGSDEPILGNETTEKRDLEKWRRLVEPVNEGSLNLKLGGQVFPLMERDKCEEKSGKKPKVSGAVCQVEDCRADLSNAKDYHCRHKVCDVHSKATRALVGSVMQRFCQQCSRFHVLEEFDEGKRSCRRRLAGHNKRRRKTQLDNAVSATTQNNEQGSNSLLIGLLRILSNIHSSSSDQPKDEDMLTHLLRNLASFTGQTDERNPAELPVSQNLQTAVKDSTRPLEADVIVPSSNLSQKSIVIYNPQGNASASQQTDLHIPKKASNSIKDNGSVGRVMLSNIDLNNVYDGSQDCMDDASPPHNNSRNSCSTSSQSLSTSSGEAQSRTDRIVIKLFGKDPSDFPLGLRKQILDWLSSSPTDIESYIRPGCVILTMFVCMDQYTWEELYCNLNSTLRRLLDSSSDSFWRTGWIYARVRHRATFLYNGHVVLDTPLPNKTHQSCRISSITPLAVSLSETVHFLVKGFNLSRSTSRLLCALEGKYLVHENCADMVGGPDLFIEHEEEDIQCLSFSCVMPNTVGRGFIEVEDHSLSSSSFFPFIVAEKDVCSEICYLESIIESGDDELEERNQALEFVHEMGWLLRKSRLGASGADVDLFPFKRFRWLIEFSVDHGWCAVVKKLLSIVFDGTTVVDSGQHTRVLVALLDVGVLHRAVRTKGRSMVEFLLEYRSPSGSSGSTSDYLFRPDASGPGGLTPLHIAASLDGCENILNALTEDPESVGLEAWKKARDSTGLTPHDYACLRGHYSYIHLLQRKSLNKKSRNDQVVVDIPPRTLLDYSSHSTKQQKQKTAEKSAAHVFETERKSTGMMHCSRCEQKLAYGRQPRASLAIYRPAMLSMVAIAAVCVCAALLFKSSPEVVCSFKPFRWELLKFGSQ